MNRIIKFRAWTDNLKDRGEMYYREKFEKTGKKITDNKRLDKTEKEQ